MDEEEEEEEEHKNIPAVMPYEARQALLREIRRGKRKLDLSSTKVEKLKEERQEPREQPDSAEHFLYGNMPVVEYQLSDGTGGTVGKTPRRRRR